MPEGDRGRQAQAEIQAAIGASQGPAQIGPMVGAGLSTVGVGGYQFDPEQIAALIPKWEALKDDIDADLIALQTAAQHVSPPSPDQPAIVNATATAKSIGAAIEHNLELRRYAQAWIDKLHQANGTYVREDEEVRTGLNSGSSPTDGHGLYQ